MSHYQTVTLDFKGQIAVLTLNRPEVHNAFNAQMITEIIDALKQVGVYQHTRVLVLQAQGESFCAGADLSWMQQMVHYGYEENLADAQTLAHMFESLNTMPVPVIAKVQGAAFGGGVGLLACSDIVIATPNFKASLSEVKIGIIPAVISPYIIEAISARQARRYAITAELIDAETAHQIGLVHHLLAPDQLDLFLEKLCQTLCKNAPNAIKETKDLLRTNASRSINSTMIEENIRRIAKIRISEEGQEGLKAFLEKRKAAWQHQD